MTAAVVLVTLLLAPATAVASPARAPAPIVCETFTRNGATLPPLVRAWFAHSSDERVRICPQSPASTDEGTAPLYFGEGPVAQHGTVCSYASHVLTVIGSGAGAHLQRHEQTEALEMALAGTECPRPHARAHDYVETYDVSAAAFVSLMSLWSETSAAITALESHASCCASKGSAASGLGRPAASGDAAAADALSEQLRARLETTLGPGRIGGATVARVVRIPGSVLHHRYALFLEVPERTAGAASLYVLYVDKHLRGPYRISAFAETN